ncbi:MAG: hypothetical protein ACI85I_001911 [Arenicella sp.]|jgi:hypothetical protein
MQTASELVKLSSEYAAEQRIVTQFTVFWGN